MHPGSLRELALSLVAERLRGRASPRRAADDGARMAQAALRRATSEFELPALLAANPAHDLGRYDYLSYAFTNVSADIRDLFVAACLLVDLDVRPGKRTVRINRRGSVARLLEQVGGKT